MGRRRTSGKTLVGVTYDFEPDLINRFDDLVRQKGLKRRDAFRRLMIGAIMEGEIYGVSEAKLPDELEDAPQTEAQARERHLDKNFTEAQAEEAPTAELLGPAPRPRARTPKHKHVVQPS